MPRGAPSTIFSSASVKSAELDLLVVAARGRQRRLVGEVGEVGADHAGRGRGDAGRGRRRRPSGSERVWTSRILRRPSLSGGGTVTRRSKRPGRSSAVSRISGRFVAPSTITATLDSKPSISVRIWLSVCSRSSLPPPKPTPCERERPIASSSSMKMIAGEASLAGLEQVAHARGADADDRLDELRRRDREERHARLARRPRVASSVLPVPGWPESSTPRGIRPPSLLVALRVLEEVDDLGQLRLGLVDAGHVGERDPLLAALDAPRARARERAERAHRRRRRRRGGPGTRTAPTSSSTGPKPRIRLVNRLPELIGLASTMTSWSWSSFDSSIGVRRRSGSRVWKFLAAVALRVVRRT